MSRQIGERACGATVSDDSAGRGHRVDHNVVADRNAVDLGAYLDHLAGGLVSQRCPALPRRDPADRDVHGVRPADPAGPAS